MFDILIPPILAGTSISICLLFMYCCSHAAFAGTSPAREQHRTAGRASTHWSVISGPAGPQQKSSAHSGSLVPQTAGQPAGAASHRYNTTKDTNLFTPTIHIHVLCENAFSSSFCVPLFYVFFLYPFIIPVGEICSRQPLQGCSARFFRWFLMMLLRLSLMCLSFCFMCFLDDFLSIKSL